MPDKHKVLGSNPSGGTDAPFIHVLGALLASVVESVDTATLKVAAYGRAGSSPAGGTVLIDVEGHNTHLSISSFKSTAANSRNNCVPVGS